MPFSLGSYLWGVGTVVGALAFGFGGGVLLTNTAMKESPPGQTRIERVARAEPGPAAAPTTQAAPTTVSSNQAAAAPNQVTTVDQVHSASVAANTQDAPAQQPAAVRPDPVPASQAEPLKTDAARKTEPDTPRLDTPRLDTPRQIEAAREPKQAAVEPQPPKQVDQPERTEAKAVESREADRRTERSRRYADRKQRDIAAPGMRQRRFEVQEELAPEVVVSTPPEQHFNLLGGLFGRPVDANN